MDDPTNDKAIEAGNRYAIDAGTYLEKALGTRLMGINHMASFAQRALAGIFSTAFLLLRGRAGDESARKWVNDVFADITTVLYKHGCKCTVNVTFKDEEGETKDKR